MGFLLVAGLAWQLWDPQWKSSVGSSQWELQFIWYSPWALGSVFPHDSISLTWSDPTWACLLLWLWSIGLINAGLPFHASVHHSRDLGRLSHLTAPNCAHTAWVFSLLSPTHSACCGLLCYPPSPARGPTWLRAIGHSCTAREWKG